MWKVVKVSPSQMFTCVHQIFKTMSKLCKDLYFRSVFLTTAAPLTLTCSLAQVEQGDKVITHPRIV